MFYKNLKKMCVDKGIEMSEVLAVAQLTPGTATWWKNGSIPRPKTLKKIADFLGTTLRHLLHGVDAPPLGCDSAASSDVPTSDRELGRLEGRIEELEKQILRYEAQIERHDSQISEVLNSVSEMLNDKKTGRKQWGVGAVGSGVSVHR